MKGLVFPLPPIVAISICTLLGVVGALVLFGVIVFVVVKIRNRKKPAGGAMSLPGLLGNAAGSPLVKEVEKVLVAAIHQSQHAALNAAVARAFPGLAPFITGPLDRAADLLLDKVVGTQDAPPALPPALPTVVPAKPLFIPPDHPILDLLHKTLEAFHAQQQAQKAPPVGQ